MTHDAAFQKLAKSKFRVSPERSESAKRMP